MTDAVPWHAAWNDRGCRLAIEDGIERLTKDVLNQFTVTPVDMPHPGAASGEQPDIPVHKLI
ncbi:hypothetical protein ACWC4A_19065 [Streptomyces mirabilis]